MGRSAIAAALALGLLATGAFAAGDPATGKLKAAVCSACHGADGNSIDAIWPKLAGQGAPYQMRQVMAIRSEHGRVNPEAATMVPMVVNLSEEDLADIAAYFATQVSTVEAADPELAEVGRRLYQAGDPERNIPSCMSCHGPGGRGNRLAAFPQLGGQHAAVLCEATACVPRRRADDGRGRHDARDREPAHRCRHRGGFGVSVRAPPGGRLSGRARPFAASRPKRELEPEDCRSAR